MRWPSCLFSCENAVMPTRKRSLMTQAPDRVVKVAKGPFVLTLTARNNGSWTVALGDRVLASGQPDKSPGWEARQVSGDLMNAAHQAALDAVEKIDDPMK
jgi:hypothetical protein